MKQLQIVFFILSLLLGVSGCSTNTQSHSVSSGAKEIDEVEVLIQSMSLEEKVGQLFIVGIDGQEVNEEIRSLVEDYKVGGLIFYGRNVKDSDQLLNLLNGVKGLNQGNQIPLILSVDEEGGAVTRAPKEIVRIPVAREIGSSASVSFARNVGFALGEILNTFGYNMNFAPVLDIDSNSKNPVIGRRSLGKEPKLVGELGIAIIEGMKSKGIIPVVKHFPGHGDTDIDSHVGLPILKNTVEELVEFELLPFKEAIDGGTDVVMVGHILMENIDPELPATMSKILVEGLLRNTLGFDGVAITDDLTMGAIVRNYDLGHAAIQSIYAGLDMILVGHEYNNMIYTIEAIKSAVQEEKISIKRIDESLYRILKLKKDYNLNNEIVENLDLTALNQSIIELLDD